MHVFLTAPPFGQDADALFSRVRAAGCDHVVMPAPFPTDGEGRLRDPGAEAGMQDLRSLADAAEVHGLRLILDLRIDEIRGEAELAASHPHWFRPRGAPLPDPRGTRGRAEIAQARFDDAGDAEAQAQWWGKLVEDWLQAGAAGLRVLQPQRTPPEVWSRLFERARGESGSGVFWAWTPGLSRDDLGRLRGAGFDAVFSSLAWWDARAGWFLDEDAALRAVAPSVIALVDAPDAQAAPDERARRARSRRLAIAESLGGAWAVAAGAMQGAPPPEPFHPVPNGQPARIRPLLPEGGAVAALLLETPGTATSVVLTNADDEHVVPVPVAAVLQAAGELGRLIDADGEPVDADHPLVLEPGEVRACRLDAGRPMLTAARDRVRAEDAAGDWPRVVIEAVTPAVDDGRFAVKRVVGDRVVVEADAFCDGHERIATGLLWREADAKGWNRAPMRAIGNDRWRGEFALSRLGRYEFKVEAWRDVYATTHADLEKKRAAGTLLPVDVTEGVALVEAALARSRGRLASLLKGIVARLRKAGDDELARVEVLLDPATAQAMAQADDRPFRSEYPAVFPVEAERRAARYASWYELFPRSQSGDGVRHGTFDDVIAQLPRIRAMHFDVLYMPPIHPIGVKNRKGRNNAVSAQEGEPGSPYAIGSAEGGHTDIHPELGGIEGFRRLRDAAAAQGLELALDFAIQCAPDHPWLTEHADWFTWRADGSIPYAENPPKKYQDIVNVDFHAKGAVPALWNTLRDVVLFWVAEGVTLFRVDNPHTKPFPFWEWMIAEVRGRHPEVVFLSEAFTRPKVMYRLAKVGFSQSYTYFTWRNHKAELTAYMEELNQGVPAACFRPHFFVNTPDINPVYLQTSGRAGHLVRAALAATLSGLWGVYQGFELCEAAPLPGKEEYLDSDKYQLRVWPARRAGDIVEEIARLNLLRRLNPELQTHLGTRFYAAHNDRILYYGKFLDEGHLARARSMVLVAVNLDPHAVQAADFEVPLWEFGLPDHAGVEVDDLWNGHGFRWDGKLQHLRLDPAQPFAIWRIRAGGAA